MLGLPKSHNIILVRCVVLQKLIYLKQNMERVNEGITFERKHITALHVSI